MTNEEFIEKLLSPAKPLVIILLEVFQAVSIFVAGFAIGALTIAWKQGLFP